MCIRDRSIAAEVTNFVDEVTDTGVLNEKHVADLYLACSAYGPLVDVQVLRLSLIHISTSKYPSAGEPTSQIRIPLRWKARLSISTQNGRTSAIGALLVCCYAKAGRHLLLCLSQRCHPISISCNPVTCLLGKG